MKKYLIIIIFGVSPLITFSQTVNEGLMTVLPETNVSTVSNFDNISSGVVVNNGNFYFYSNFNNDGLYMYDSKEKVSLAIFQSYDKNTGKQELRGTVPSEFYDVLFDNSTHNFAFDLKNDISIGGIANFKEGIIRVDSLEGAMVFKHGAKAINVSDLSFADGIVEKLGDESFDFPIGNKEKYRMAAISAPKYIRDHFFSRYHYTNSNSICNHSKKESAIELIDDKEYWIVEKEKDTKSSIILTLTWDERTTPEKLLKKPEDNLRILRWDNIQKMWIDEGGIVDTVNKTVSSPTTVGGFGIFTLGTIKPNFIIDGDIVIYNAVSPNGDGDNDHFVIKNIERFPHNTVNIFNRWGVKVYSTTGYNNENNNFVGISDGRVTIKRNEKLPSGTYYYIVEYEYKDSDGERMIKKSGYLHLEN